MTLFKFE